MGSGPVLCGGCQARITFVTVTTRAGKRSRMPLNDKPDPAGNVAVRTSGQSKVGRVAALTQALDPDEVRYMPHFASCPNPPRKRKDKRHTAKAPVATHATFPGMEIGP